MDSIQIYISIPYRSKFSRSLTFGGSLLNHKFFVHKKAFSVLLSNMVEGSSTLNIKSTKCGLSVKFSPLKIKDGNLAPTKFSRITKS